MPIIYNQMEHVSKPALTSATFYDVRGHVRSPFPLHTPKNIVVSIASLQVGLTLLWHKLGLWCRGLTEHGGTLNKQRDIFSATM
jgi:hypothetical protein